MAAEVPLRPIHPFPARMAASIALDQLRNKRCPLRVLDPLAGSGTTLVAAKRQGHTAIGFDTDPLAVLLAKAWSMDVSEHAVRKAAELVLRKATRSAKRLKFRNAYPCPKEDQETRRFIRYWFDRSNRRQLTALAWAIRQERDRSIQTLLWCAFSRMIITKQASVSLAMDLSHSRPHRVRNHSGIRPFDKFLISVDAVLAAAPFKNRRGPARAKVKCGDARKLPLNAESVDFVITSPPYLNAIDYLRCHKFSLVWMGHSISSLRALRARNIGSEVGLPSKKGDGLDEIVRQMTGRKTLPARYQRMLRRYVADMRTVVDEIARVLVRGGTVTFVVGNSTLLGVFVQNSKAVSLLGQESGLRLISTKSRVLPNNRRYLPPPSKKNGAIHKRMRTEVIVTLRKTS